MHLIPLIAALAFLPLAASAQNETVTVRVGDPIGIWKVSVPRGFDFAFFSKTKWSPNTDVFCQIEKISSELTVHCLGFHIGSKDVSRGAVSIHGNNIRMTWGSNLIFAGINGTLKSANEFDGAFFVQVFGVSDDAPGKSKGARLSLSENSPDNGGKSGLLTRILDEMAKGAFTAPLNTSVTVTTATPNTSYIRILKPDTLLPLGGVQSMIYLGEMGDTNPTSVYDVEFSNGHLICGLHQDADNKLDQFDCG